MKIYRAGFILAVLTAAIILAIGWGLHAAGKKIDPATDKNVTFPHPVVQHANGDIELSMTFKDPNSGEDRTVGPRLIQGIPVSAAEKTKRAAVVAQLARWTAAYNELVAARLPITAEAIAQRHCNDCGGGCTYVVLPGRGDGSGPCAKCVQPYNCNAAVYYCPGDPSPSCGG